MVVTIAVTVRMIRHIIVMMRHMTTGHAAGDCVEIAASGVVAVTLCVDLLVKHFEYLARVLDAANLFFRRIRIDNRYDYQTMFTNYGT